jgi:twitching motility protein PilT
MDTADKLLLDKLLAAIAEYKASDLHLVPGNFPVLRISGKLAPLSTEPPVTANFLAKVIDTWLSPDQKQELQKNKSLIFSYVAANKMRFKVSVYYQQGTLAIAMRALPSQIRDFSRLGLPNKIQEIVNLKRGLIIITGPFGSGKTTMMASIIEYFNRNIAKHIITLEKPIEYIFTDNQSIIEQREVGKDVGDFTAGLKFIFEEDVDIVAVSQLESAEEIKQVFELVDSGRLVLAVMNTESTAQTLESLLNNFSNNEQQHAQKQIARTLSGVICLKLLPATQGGQAMAVEFFFPNEVARSIIASGEFNKLDNLMYNAQEDEGMLSFDGSLAKLANEGVINLKTALENAHDQEHMKALINKSE